MKVERKQYGVEIFLSWEEARELRKHLETIGWHKSVTKELLSELDEILTEEGT